MSGILRRRIYDLLPPHRPGILKAEIIESLTVDGKPPAKSSVEAALTDMRMDDSLRDDGERTRRHWRGPIAPPDAVDRGHRDWSEAEEMRLRALWAEGHSCAEIGRRMGVTKCSVVGKAHRLDLPSRPSPIIRNGSRKRIPTLSLPSMRKAPPQIVARLSAPPPRKPEPPPIEGLRVPCRWPLWSNTERPTHCYCEVLSEPSRSYCEAHCQLAYPRSGARERDFTPQTGGLNFQAGAP